MKQTELRRHARMPLRCELTISWKDSNGQARSLQAGGVDISESGIRIETNEPVEPASRVYLRAESYGVSGSASIRHCNRHGNKYVLGLEFDTRQQNIRRQEGEGQADYYEVLQISPNAEMETIHRVFRILAARYHPDNPESGNNERFLLLSEAYATLSDPDRRRAYDSIRQGRQSEPMAVFGLKEFVDDVEGEANRRMGLLCLLYQRRRMNPEHPGIPLLDLESLMSFPREHLMFTTWFLKEMEFVQLLSNSDYAITAQGARFVESNVPSNPVLHQLLLPALRSHKEQPHP
ncbi:MAG: DnaJ domain-containing protein [Acidobacteriota bacterium]|nr:MAG: DnaJ domain-containing protein [Acidobacteriota bacterium]